MRLPAAWKPSLEASRMLVLSISNDKTRRPSAKTTATTAERNALVVGLAASLLAPHAEPGGKVESVCKAALAAGKPVLTRPDRPDDDQLREARDLHLYALREECEREDFGESLEDRI